jgi:hypothetical protein
VLTRLGQRDRSPTQSAPNAHDASIILDAGRPCWAAVQTLSAKARKGSDRVSVEGVRVHRCAVQRPHLRGLHDSAAHRSVRWLIDIHQLDPSTRLSGVHCCRANRRPYLIEVRSERRGFAIVDLHVFPNGAGSMRATVVHPFGEQKAKSLPRSPEYLQFGAGSTARCGVANGQRW